MPRPRIHSVDDLLDATEQIAVHAGPSAVTVRAVSQATGVSNGAIYHAFGSRGAMVGQAWLRAAARFLEMQRAAVDEAFAAGEPADTAAVNAVVAAADAPAVFAERFPESSLLVLGVRREDLLGSDIPHDVAEAMGGPDAALVALFMRLSRALWGRDDGRAVRVIEDCIVGLPTGLLLRGRRPPDAASRSRLEAAVRAILALDPPRPTARSPKAEGANMKGNTP
ncbi:TetR/AcrR family transcriptional regulator [Mycobacterium sp. CBMA271]|uniref:TetR/AcrR family transcriptional regulator n=1 Tax=unclassified Mycobacteroides TaxID=2618759 RepID=UPI0013239EE7|nr:MULTISPECIES: TetR/AcrR family transcriptional regulator [unclassified Mycobacteroides]MUM17615.1 TetR family transcriptional regulator [Mycobacteroides sp. CBMA 326]MUM23111.1 TetR/AcrR family transcriptional regulator [Mycobacteroides sp. CBMA 271]